MSPITWLALGFVLAYGAAITGCSPTEDFEEDHHDRLRRKVSLVHLVLAGVSVVIAAVASVVNLLGYAG